MRQDAVMEQVFALVNKVLSSDRETSKRSLKVRGYKVIPLAAQAGVLEFVNNTKPLRDWLLYGHKVFVLFSFRPVYTANLVCAQVSSQRHGPHDRDQENW
jgi:hypothetical protein